MTDQDANTEHHERTAECWRDGILGQQLVDLLEAAFQSQEPQN